MLICKSFTQFHRCQRVHRTCWAQMEMRCERKNLHNKLFNWANEKSRMNRARFYTYRHEMAGNPSNNMMIQYWQTRNFFVHPLGRAVAFDIILTIIMMMLNGSIEWIIFPASSADGLSCDYFVIFSYFVLWFHVATNDEWLLFIAQGNKYLSVPDCYHSSW